VRHLVLLTLLLPLVAHAGVLDETRYCGTPARDAGGKIIRHSEVVAAFRKVHPCPSTHKTTGACPGWAVDHVVSLGAKHPILGGGCDAVSNMQWLPLEIKSCAGVICKDRWELSVYSLQGATP
jgi:hypothetical protein